MNLYSKFFTKAYKQIDLITSLDTKTKEHIQLTLKNFHTTMLNTPNPSKETLLKGIKEINVYSYNSVIKDKTEHNLNDPDFTESVGDLILSFLLKEIYMEVFK